MSSESIIFEMHNANAVRDKFGRFASKYATCEVQAGDYTLARLVELVQPRRDWKALDVATGAGHTAVLFSKSVREVVATDLTPEMLVEARKLARREQRDNIRFITADAGEIPFPDNTFDLLTCRLAIHHFTDVDRFFREAQRVLKRGGLLAIVDSHLPPNAAFTAINRIQTLQDPSHHSCLTRNRFSELLRQHLFRPHVIEEGSVRLGFRSWIARSDLPCATISQLRSLMTENCDQDTASLLDIKPDEREEFTFSFQRILIVCSKN